MTHRLDEDDPTIKKLAGILIATISDFSYDNKGLTTGQAMGALFAVLVHAAKESPNYDPKKLVAEMDARIREAVNLQ